MIIAKNVKTDRNCGGCDEVRAKWKITMGNVVVWLCDSCAQKLEESLKMDEV